MARTSVVIPARNEVFLEETVRDLLNKARGDIEVIPVLEGYWPEPEKIVEDPRVHYIHSTKPRGMRGAINAGVAVSRGEYLMKVDAHCMFEEGFDVTLAADLEYDWVAVPRRYSLNPEEWTRRPKRPHDYQYLCYPDDPNDFGGASLKGRDWPELNNNKELEQDEIVDLMSAQGSSYFMHRAYWDWLELLDEENYGHFSNEFQELGLKVWLSGGRVIRNKKTWYAHLHKGKKYGRMWPLSKSVLNKGAAYTLGWMQGKHWHKQDRDIRWMVNKFWPVPTWPEESVRLVFHRRRGASGVIRGVQMAQWFKARINPDTGWKYDFDVHIWVKQQPPEDFAPHSYLDVLDEPRRIPWLLKHPEIGVIASSQTGQEYLKAKLERDDVLLIPQHHCNYARDVRTRRQILVAGVIGGQGAIQCDIEELKRRLAEVGIEFKWEKNYGSAEEVSAFYKSIDVQIVWRKEQRPLKNPLKLINAMSFGIPTIAYPEVAYTEVEGFYWPATTMDELIEMVGELRLGFDTVRLIDKAEEYHIENIAKLYGQLL